MAACGYTSPIYNNSEKLGKAVVEKYGKESEDGLYYPIHRNRMPKELYKTGFDDDSVEYRAISAYSTFSNMVHSVTSTYWLTVAAIAKQRSKDPHFKDDATNKRLAQAWDDLEGEWTQFLKDNTHPAVDLSANESVKTYKEAYYDGDILLSRPKVTPYNRAIGRLTSLAEADTDFRDKVRNLMIEHRGVIKMIIDESMKTKKVQPHTQPS
jgi:hypothetical protein